ncbi:MAG: hypothetical protein HYW26_05660 [Candidatus Aenigmarchaeota archaeon]|nr:hypothetical protein [Candidatus Aenigmarchaeota archaeon]
MSKDFKPQDYFRYKKLGTRWQKPRGKQSKLRKSKKGAGKMPSIGRRSPRKFRGLERGFIKATVVKSVGDMNSVKDGAVIISSSLGKRKAAEIAVIAQQRNIRLLNMKSADAAKRRHEEILKKKEKKFTNKEKAKAEKKEEEAKTESKEETNRDKQNERKHSDLTKS